MEHSAGGPTLPSEVDHFPATGPNSLARFVHRGLARAIDSAIIGVPVLLVGAATLVAADKAAGAPLPRWVSIVWFVLAILYEATLVTWRGQTVGKMVMGIKVSRLDNGGRPHWSQAAIRIALPAVSAALPLQWAIVVYVSAYTTASWNPLRRGIHDQAAGTIVVATR